MRTGALVLLTAVLWGCGSSARPNTACDELRSCPSGRVCITDGVCAQTCSFDGGGCPDGASCSGSGPYCPPGGACPAIAVLVCLYADGGAP